MNWKGHLCLGTVFLILATVIIYLLCEYADLIIMEINAVVIGWIVGIYCSLLPDIDIKTSKVFTFTMFCALVMCLIFVISGMIIELVALVVFLILILGLEHRGLMHKWYMAPAFALLFGLIFSSVIVGIFAFFGYFSHVAFEKSH